MGSEMCIRDRSSEHRKQRIVEVDESAATPFDNARGKDPVDIGHDHVGSALVDLGADDAVVGTVETRRPVDDGVSDRVSSAGP